MTHHCNVSNRCTPQGRMGNAMGGRLDVAAHMAQRNTVVPHPWNGRQRLRGTMAVATRRSAIGAHHSIERRS